MAPSAVETTPAEMPVRSKAPPPPSESESHTGPRAPLKTTGVLNAYESFDVTPVIGREFPRANLVEWLHAPNSDELIRDLAITSETCHLVDIILSSPTSS